MEEKYRAVVLYAVDYKDNDKILTLLSPEGTLSAAARGVKRANSKLKFAAQPFCFCDFVMRSSGERLSVVSADLVDGFYPVREDITRLMAGSAALEFCRAFLAEGMEAGDVFIALIKMLESMCYGGARPKPALVKFLLASLSASGYELTLGECIKCRKTHKNRVFFDFNAGGGLCADCAGDDAVEINPMTMQLLSEADKKDFSELCALQYPEMIESKAVRLLTRYIDVKTGVTLRSAGELLSLGK